MESPEWVKLPWNDIPKSHFHQLLDIMARLANGIEVGYQLFANPSQPPNPATLLPAVSGIIERCWISDARLRCFYQVFEKETPGPLHWPKLSTGDDRPGDDPKLGKVFPVAFHFTNRRTAHTCMLYWAACSILWSGMRYLYGVLAAIHSLQAVQNLEGSNSHDSSGLDSPIGFDISQLPPLEHREDTVPLARNICQSTEYMVEDSAGPVGPAYAVFALKVAIETFNDSPGCDRELKWAMAVMDKIAGAGVRIMSHIPEPITHHTFLPG